MPTVNWDTVLARITASGLSVGVLLRLFWGTLSEHMLAGLKAKHEKELEALKQEHAQLLARYQHEFDKTILVTKVHFETEFNALKESFQKLAATRLELAGIRPIISVGNADETRDDRLKALSARLTKLVSAYNELVFTTENLSPFYPREIYDQIDECQRAAWTEITDLQTAGDETFSRDWFKQGETNITRFMKAYHAVSVLIRDHIAKLAIARPS
jgi:hypothetical protein